MKRKHRFVAAVLAVLVAFSMVGSAILVYFEGGFAQPEIPAQTALDPAKQLQALKDSTEAIKEQAKANPADLTLQTELGNAYYDLGMAALDLAPGEAKDYLLQAVTVYQNVLKSKRDINILVDLATAAFNAGEQDLAARSFQQALAEKPDFYPALFNYGKFLFEAKQDYLGAIEQWQKALQLNPSQQDAEMLKTLIAAAQGQLNGNSKK